VPVESTQIFLFDRRSSCPSCGLEDSRKQATFGIINPWVLEIGGVSTSDLFHKYSICTRCKCGWFQLAYPKILIDNLYAKYRGSNYFQVRNSWDKSYSITLNNGLKNDKIWMQSRQRSVETFLQASGINPNKIQSCVDIGGGEGGVIPDLPNAAKFILETNTEILLQDGVEKIETYEELKVVNPDLIMCCGLLEHLNSPKEFLEFISSIVKDETYFYFEVPVGVPSERQISKIKMSITKALSRSRRFWSLAIILEKQISKLTRRNMLPLRISEHLNFFSEESLLEILHRGGYEVLNLNKFAINSLLPGGKSLSFTASWQIVAKKQ
jgi:Methyltransferase domain